MSKLKNLGNFSLFLFGGFLAGFLSLIIAVLFYPVFFTETSASVFILVTLEEIVKILFLWFLFNSIRPDNKLFYFFAIAFGVGFGVLEIILIYLKFFTFNLQVFSPLIIHVITSLLIALGISLAQNRKTILAPAIFFLIAIAIHFAYNMQINFL